MFWHRTNINSLTFMMDNLHKKVRCDVDILFHDECRSCFYCCCGKDIPSTLYIIFIHAAAVSCILNGYSSAGAGLGIWLMVEEKQ